MPVVNPRRGGAGRGGRVVLYMSFLRGQQPQTCLQPPRLAGSLRAFQPDCVSSVRGAGTAGGFVSFLVSHPGRVVM